MRYKDNGYNRLLAGDLYTWWSDGVEYTSFEKHYQNREPAKI